ncbi:unnamed protein product [Rotaria sp. Silwood1]|nr:unnamed protein product [Rotaria sp. Silwood1]
MRLLRTVSNPELHKIDELPEETLDLSKKLNQSLTDIIQSSQEPSFSSATKKPTTTKSTSDSSTNEEKSESDDDDDEEDEMQPLAIAYQSQLYDDENENENKIKHSASESVIKKDKSKELTTQNDDDIDNDDDDVWCNPEDEDNLEHRVKLDQEKEKQLREVLGDETLEIVREALKKNDGDTQALCSLLPEDKRYLIDTDILFTLITMNARFMTK